MKVLQLTSDWKWTGPAEPMLLLHRALESLGETVFLGCPKPPDTASEGLWPSAQARGVEPSFELSRGRGARWFRDRTDARALAAFLDQCDIDVLHTWHTRDHVLALRAAAARRRSGQSIVVRSYRSAERIARTPWNRWLFGQGCDGLSCVSPKTASLNASLRGGRPLLGALGVVEVDRFASAAPASPALRAELGLQPSAPVIGVVARVQRHRRFDLLFAAMQELSKTHPRAQLLILGRGTHIEEVAKTPVRELGLEGRVRFAGHRGGDYPQVLRALDLLTFLVPGSDGSCRAVLEAAACGIPSVVTGAGALPEIVVDGETGLVVGPSARSLALSWSRLLADEQERQRLGAGAQRRAQKLFVPERLATECARVIRRRASPQAGLSVCAEARGDWWRS